MKTNSYLFMKFIYHALGVVIAALIVLFCISFFKLSGSHRIPPAVGCAIAIMILVEGRRHLRSKL